MSPASLQRPCDGSASRTDGFGIGAGRRQREAAHTGFVDGEAFATADVPRDELCAQLDALMLATVFFGTLWAFGFLRVHWLDEPARVVRAVGSTVAKAQ